MCFFFGNVRWRIDATDSCKLQNEQKNKNANGCPLRWPFGKIHPLSGYFPLSICLNGVCQGHRATAVTCQFVKHLQRLLLLLLPLQLITIT